MESTIIFKGKDVCATPILEIEELEAPDYHKEKNTFEEFQTPMAQS